MVRGAKLTSNEGKSMSDITTTAVVAMEESE